MANGNAGGANVGTTGIGLAEYECRSTAVGERHEKTDEIPHAKEKRLASSKRGA
jgi:hypothetical protein